MRPYERPDIDLDIEMATDPMVMKYFGGTVDEKSIVAESENFTRRCGGGCIGVWTVVHRRTQEKLGEVFLAPLPVDAEDTQWELVQGDALPHGDIELGYLFKRSAWGKGIATEACRRLVRFAFEETPLDQLVGIVEDGNAASKRVLLKCGFVCEGSRRAYAAERLALRITRQQFLARSSVSPRGQPVRGCG